MIRIAKHQESGFSINTSVASLLCIVHEGERKLSLALHSDGVLDLDRKSADELVEAFWRARAWLRRGIPPQLVEPPTVLGLRRALAYYDEHVPNFVSDMGVVKSAIQVLINKAVAQGLRRLEE